MASELFINRELSWLEFNARVLSEADSNAVPLFERLKFLAIFASNLDEFFMVRVAGLQTQRLVEMEEVPPDGLTPDQQLAAISARAHELVSDCYRTWNDSVLPGLKREGLALVAPDELSASDLAVVDEHFRRAIFPVLTPIAIDPVHPFPHVRNKSINVGFLFENAVGTEPSFGVVQVPQTLPRLILVPLEGTRRAFISLENLIQRNRALIFPQMKISGSYAFRVTRNFDIEIDEDEAEDLLLSLQAELRRREQGHAVRLEVSGDAPDDSLAWLCRELDIDRDRDVYHVEGPLFLGDMTELTSGAENKHLRDEPYNPVYALPFRDSEDFFETIRKRDILLHHPYESFDAVVDFLSRAAEGPTSFGDQANALPHRWRIASRQSPTARSRTGQTGHYRRRA